MAFVYSCCFWFSLRLGGILIGIFSVFQGLIALVGNCYAHTHTKQLKDQITYWTNNFDLIHLAHYLEYIKEGYSVQLFRFGAAVEHLLSNPILKFQCNNTLMIPYMVMETTRLVLLSILIANFLFLLKQNTMDIGLLIGASVGAGFFLLGMFYLWVCAVNLPIVVNEIKLDEQAATIRKLKQILETSNQRTFADTVDNLPNGTDYGQPRNMMFIVPRNGLINS